MSLVSCHVVHMMTNMFPLPFTFYLVAPSSFRALYIFMLALWQIFSMALFRVHVCVENAPEGGKFEIELCHPPTKRDIYGTITSQARDSVRITHTIALQL